MALHYGDIVLLKWCNGGADDGYISSVRVSQVDSSPEDVKLLVLKFKDDRFTDLDESSNFPVVTNLKMVSFKIEGGDVGYPVCFEHQIKLWNMHTEKYITLGEPIGQLGREDTSRKLYFSDSIESDPVFEIARGNATEQVCIESEVEFHKATTHEKSNVLRIAKSNRNYQEIAKHELYATAAANSDSVFIIQRHDNILPKIEDAVLQCDGHNKLLQNYLREQPWRNSNSSNKVKQICERFCSVPISDSESVIEILITMCMGNIKNQQVFLNDARCAIGTVNEIMNKSQNKRLLKLTVRLLEILCEEIDPRLSKKYVQTIYQHIDILALHRLMGFFCCQSDAAEIASAHPCCKLYETKLGFFPIKNDASTAIAIHNLLMHMEDFGNIKAVPRKHGSHIKSWNQRSRIIEEFYENKGTCSRVNSQQVQNPGQTLPMAVICSPSYEDHDHDHDKNHKAWHYCHENYETTEVFYENEEKEKILTRVHFTVYPEDKLSPKQEDNVKRKVNCGDPINRLERFLLGFDSIENEIKHMKFLHSRWYTRIFTANSGLLNYVLTFWTLVMNILLIIAWEGVDLQVAFLYNPPENGAMLNNTESMLNNYCVETSCYNSFINSSMFKQNDCNKSLCVVSETLTPTVPDIDDHKHWFFDCVLYIGGSIHLLLSLAMALSFILIHYPHLRGLKKIRYLCKNMKKTCDCFEENEPTDYFELPFHLSVLKSAYVLVFLACSILSLRFYGYFYCICLLHVTIDNAILRRVLKAITRNGLRLAWLVVLGVVVIYVYSVAAFAFFANEFHDPDADKARYCRTLLQCAVTMFDYILLDMSSDSSTGYTNYAIKLIFFDITFFFIILAIGLNIVYGIVVDTFIALREEWQIKRDSKQICFICQKFSSEFEEKARGFDHHILNDHYMFNYVYYKLYLDRKLQENDLDCEVVTDKVARRELNAIEYYVYNQIKNKQIDFFPLFGAKCLQDELITNI